MTTYYVDYANGSDANSGASISAPWKHAPGDLNATGNAWKASLVGGDKVLFKAGVVYQGQIIFRASGTDGNPIVYEGTGWGTGHATLSGQTTVQVNFTPLADNSNLSVATLPSGWTPNRYSVVDIDGRQSFMSNTSASTNPYFISDASSATPNAVTYQASEMTGSGTSWTLTDATLAGQLRSLAPSTIAGTVLQAFGYANQNYDLAITGFDPTTGAVSLSGAFSPAATGSYTLLNNPGFVNATNPYSEYAVEGNQIIAAVAPGIHSLSLSTYSAGIVTNNQSNIKIDGFNITGYAGDSGQAICAYSSAAHNVTISNNTISNLGSKIGQPAIQTSNITNLVVSGNTIANLLHNEGIGLDADTNAKVTNNTIDQPGWTAIAGADSKNTYIIFNQISNVLGLHANGIGMYDIHGVSQNVYISNNEIDNVGVGITFMGKNINDATPNNLTVANNIITRANVFGIADWGNSNGANIYGNIRIDLARCLRPVIGCGELQKHFLSQQHISKL